MDHTVLPAITPMPAFISWAFTRWRLSRLRLRTSDCSLNQKGCKAESAWLADLHRTVYPHKWCTCQLQVERRTGKVCQSKTNVLPLYHQTNAYVTHKHNEYCCAHYSLALYLKRLFLLCWVSSALMLPNHRHAPGHIWTDVNNTGMLN